MKCVFLVSGGRNKTDHRTRAADLYTSQRFRKSRELIESIGCPWFILSAKHGLLAPDDMIDPYDRTLNTMPPEQRVQWEQNVKQQMDGQLPDADKIVILAGDRYYEHLLPYLERRFLAVDIPLKGMTPGEELSWLQNAVEVDMLRVEKDNSELSDDDSGTLRPGVDFVVPLEAFRRLDINAALVGCNSVDPVIITERLGELKNHIRAEESDALSVLWSLASCIFGPEYERKDPFKPMWVGADGRRTLKPVDFMAEQIDVIQEFAPTVKNPGLRARLADVVWFIRPNSDYMAEVAIDAYCELVEKVSEGEAVFLLPNSSPLGDDAKRTMERAGQIYHATKTQNLESSRRFEKLLIDLIELAYTNEDGNGLYLMGGISLRYGIMPYERLAGLAKELAENPYIHFELEADLLELAKNARTQSQYSDQDENVRIKILINWFRDRYELSVNRLDSDDKKRGYQLNSNGTFDAYEVLRKNFPFDREDLVSFAAESIDPNGDTEWALIIMPTVHDHGTTKSNLHYIKEATPFAEQIEWADNKRTILVSPVPMNNLDLWNVTLEKLRDEIQAIRENPVLSNTHAALIDRVLNRLDTMLERYGDSPHRVYYEIERALRGVKNLEDYGSIPKDDIDTREFKTLLDDCLLDIRGDIAEVRMVVEKRAALRLATLSAEEQELLSSATDKVVPHIDDERIREDMQHDAEAIRDDHENIDSPDRISSIYRWSSRMSRMLELLQKYVAEFPSQLEKMREKASHIVREIPQATAINLIVEAIKKLIGL